MNKKLFRFAFALVFVLTGLVFGSFVNVVKAGTPSLSIYSLSKTSVILKATGFSPSQTFSISISNNPNVRTTPYYAQSPSVTANDKGEVQTTFTGLTPGGSYIAYTSVTKSNPISFDTNLDLASNKGSLTSKGISSNSVKLELSSALPNESYNVSLSKDPAYLDNNDTKQGEFKTNASGFVEVNFTGLTSGAHFIAEYKSVSDVTWSDPIQVETSGSTLNFSALNGIISIANNTFDDATKKEGTKVGEYPVGSKQLLSDAIDEAEYLNSDPTSILQSDINNGVVRLQYAIDTFELSKIVATNRSKNTGKIVPICNTKVDTVKGGYSDPCDFNALLKLINNVIAFLLFVIATPFIALILVYAGWLYLSASASPKNIDTAKTIFKNAILGYVLALAAWLIIKTIMTSLGLHGDGTMYLASIISKMFV